MSIDTRTKTPKEIQNLLLDTKTYPTSDDWAKTRWVPREDYDSVLEQLIDHQKYLKFKVDEYASDRYDLCQKIEDQAKEIHRLKLASKNSNNMQSPETPCPTSDISLPDEVLPEVCEVGARGRDNSASKNQKGIEK